MRRRDLLLMPTLALLPVPVKGARMVYRVRLSGPEPLARLAGLWRYGAVSRVVVRPEPGWWPAPATLPDRWQAWLELRDGSAVHVTARGESLDRPAHPVVSELVRLLTVRMA